MMWLRCWWFRLTRWWRRRHNPFEMGRLEAMRELLALAKLENVK